MSRCFPFPPPGYEKKIKTDEPDLTKEKLKEKKHKKDKKDKGKKDGKEKKDRERSKDKHKERKEKHKDSKDRDRDKEKGRTLEEEEKKTEVLPDTRDREKLVTNTLQNNGNGDARFVQDLARRIRDGEAATGSQSKPKTKIPDQIHAGLTGKVVENNGFYPVQDTNHRRDNDRRIHPQRHFAAAKSAENVVPRVPFGSDQRKTEGVVKPVERKDQEKQMESLEKNQYKGSAMNSDKPRDGERLKKTEHKDRDASKEKKQERTEVTKFIEGGPRLKERDKDALDIRNLGKRKDLERNGFLYENGSNRPNKLQRPVASPVSSSAVENGRKLGTTTRTGLQSEQTKTHPKPVSEPKSVEAKPPQKSASELQGASCKPNVKEHRVNGFIGAQELNVVRPNSLAATGKAKVKGNGEAPVKLPHPDLEYLNQILRIPEREEVLLQFDDQEWLHGDCPVAVKLKKQRTDLPDPDETWQVWDQAFRIESADTVALPYVVPF